MATKQLPKERHEHTRDQSGEIRRKRSDTMVGTLRNETRNLVSPVRDPKTGSYTTTTSTATISDTVETYKSVLKILAKK